MLFSQVLIIQISAYSIVKHKKVNGKGQTSGCLSCLISETKSESYSVSSKELVFSANEFARQNSKHNK